jgi:hypothetical protein
MHPLLKGAIMIPLLALNAMRDANQPVDTKKIMQEMMIEMQKLPPTVG